MTDIRVRRAAELLGVSDDTVRRWIASGEVTARTDESGRTVIDGADLARLATTRAPEPAPDGIEVERSARNRFVGLVTAVRSDPVMSQVTMQCGPFVVTSLMSTDAVTELDLAVGVVATAVVKATTVIVERPIP
ncbi:molybdopterin-binding protein [Williamsia sp. CHRR-6]|uniref:TOBE domain-containing protein n=1 Tax=Williamsia sp. CHRR-6 TaxID=2835871 RepID=UPI001BDA089F|nr:TOBE domain-containing protein [Williamsia sp. CHRR-6]MBT0567522.1 TOBE domain-containing protein [Williamsia sp. CHRR-6]